VRAAEAFGARGIRVDTTTDLEAALRASFNSPLPSLIDAALDDPVAAIY
jgi:thiamine pyrophosphate-dependent acetolactate synthase large subunit-like protein